MEGGFTGRDAPSFQRPEPEVLWDADVEEAGDYLTLEQTGQRQPWTVTPGSAHTAQAASNTVQGVTGMGRGVEKEARGDTKPTGSGFGKDAVFFVK